MKILLFIVFCTLTNSALRAQHDVIYHVFQRSFFDSNADGHGDLKGIEQKLNYLQDLGVTSILLTPLYQSDFYHNYFATDFEKIDEEYGSLQEYIDLVKEVHRRGMRIYQDVEMQYVTDEHLWFMDSYKNPNSRFGKYIYYLDDANATPWWFYNIREFTTYNNLKKRIAVVNLNHAAVRQYTFDILNFWVDPNKDGKFDDGVDGFRLDHMMDDLDNQKRLTGLFKNFWTPLLTDLKKTNPSLTIIAEQANWFSLGHEYFYEAMVDQVFAFGLSWAIETFNKEKLILAADSILSRNPPGKSQIVFVENHDTRRIASVKDITTGKLKVAATLNLLLGGVPLIYYGQEIGMKGRQMKGTTDGNDIPIREAFDWYRTTEGKGISLWYRKSGPWWDNTNLKPNDGISLEEQRDDNNSLWNHYKKMIALRNSHEAFREGAYNNVVNQNAQVLTFMRSTEKEKLVVAVNLSDKPQRAIVTFPLDVKYKSAKSLINNEVRNLIESAFAIQLPPHGLQVFELN
jgi:alpha-amylase